MRSCRGHEMSDNVRGGGQARRTREKTHEFAMVSRVARPDAITKAEATKPPYTS